MGMRRSECGFVGEVLEDVFSLDLNCTLPNRGSGPRQIFTFYKNQFK